MVSEIFLNGGFWRFFIWFWQFNGITIKWIFLVDFEDIVTILIIKTCIGVKSVGEREQAKGGFYVYR